MRRASPRIPRTPLVRAALAATGLLIAGCGHGQYVSEGISLAEQRQAQMKSGTEWSMAHQAFLAGNLDKAMRRVDRSLAISPDVPKSHVLKGRILMERSRLGPALESFQRAAQIDPEFVDAHYYQGLVLERLRRSSDAFRAFDRAAELEPSNAQHAIAAAEALADRNEIERARAYLKDDASRFENNPGVRHTLAHLAMLEDRHDLAVRHFRETVLLAPDDPSVVEDLADAQVAAGRFAQAERRLARLLKRDDYRNRRDLEHLRVRALIQLDRLVEARQLLLDMTEGDEGENDAHAWMALARVSLSLGRPQELKQAAGRLVAIAPERHEGFLFQAMWHRIQGDHETALKRVARARQRAPESPEVLTVRAFVLQDLGRGPAALKSLRRAAEMDPENSRIAGLIEQIEQSSAVASAPTEP